MRKYIRAVGRFVGIAKPIHRDCHGMWKTEYGIFINRTLVITCHESHFKCGVRVKILLNAPAFIRKMLQAQRKHCP